MSVSDVPIYYYLYCHLVSPVKYSVAPPNSMTKIFIVVYSLIGCHISSSIVLTLLCLEQWESDPTKQWTNQSNPSSDYATFDYHLKALAQS
jgi:hypothetical protein